MMSQYFQPVISYQRAIGVFADRQAARQALQALKASGFAMERVSMIVRKSNRSDQAPVKELEATTKVDEGTTVGAVSGVALGSLTGLLVGLGTIAIPGVGPVMLAGAAATTIATTIAGGAIGAVAGGLLGGLIGLGVPEEQAKLYYDRIARGDCLVVIEGTGEEIAIAENIFHRFGIEEYRVYNLSTPVPATALKPVVGPAPAATASSWLPASTAATYTAAGIDIAKSKYGVGFFADQRDAELAVNDLRTAGFPLNQVSLIALNIAQPERWLGLTLRDRLESMRLGMSAERARFYSDQLIQGRYLITISGTEPEIRDVAAMLEQRGIQAWQMYDPTAIDATLPVAAAPPADEELSNLSELTTAPADYTLPITHSADKSALSSHKRAIGVFTQLQSLQMALTTLQGAFPMHQVAMIAKSTEPHTEAHLSSFFVGLGTLAVPGIGSIFVAGSEATALVAAALAEGAIATAARGLVGAFSSQGIPESAAASYNAHLMQGHYLLIVHGTKKELQLAKNVLNQYGLSNWRTYSTSDSVSGSPQAIEEFTPPVTQIIESDRDIRSATMKHPPVTIIDHRHTL